MQESKARPQSSRRWAAALWVVVALALILRVVYVLGWQNPSPIQGDALYYHYGANLLADGKGFPDPYAWYINHQLIPGAQHPPLYIIVLAIPSVLGLSTYLDHQLFTCLIGALSVLTVGYTGRRIGGPSVGLLAAVLAAVYPEFWVNDALVLSESLSILVTCGVLLAAYRLAEERTVLRGVVLGVAVALAALTRAELLLFAVLLLPLMLGVRLLRPGSPPEPGEPDLVAEPHGVPAVPAPSWGRRLTVLGAAALAGVIVIAPWAIYNQTRFHHSELISSGLGSTLYVANCPTTYYSTFKGFWDYGCIAADPTPPGDMSDKDIAYRHQALDFIKAHKSVLPSLAYARLGRVWGYYKPTQQIKLDGIERRELPVSRVGLAMFYSLAIASVGGLLELRRRRVPLSPLLAPVIAVSLAAIVFYGTTRFRAAAEPSLVLLGSVGLVALFTMVSRRRHPAEAAPIEPVGPAGSARAQEGAVGEPMADY